MFIWLESKETRFSSILLICIAFISLLKHANSSLFGEKEKKKRKYINPFKLLFVITKFPKLNSRPFPLSTILSESKKEDRCQNKSSRVVHNVI